MIWAAHTKPDKEHKILKEPFESRAGASMATKYFMFLPASALINLSTLHIYLPDKNTIHTGNI